MIITGVCITSELLLVVFAINMWQSETPIKRANRYLGVVFILLAMLNLSLLFLYFAHIRQSHLFISWYFPLEHLFIMGLGPVLWFYVLLLFNPARPVTPRQIILHALPALPALVYVVYYATLPQSVRYGMIAGEAGAGGWMDKALNYIFYIQVLPYLLISYLKVHKLRGSNYIMKTKEYQYDMFWFLIFLTLSADAIMFVLLSDIQVNTRGARIGVGSMMLVIPVIYIFIFTTFSKGLSIREVEKIPARTARGLKMDDEQITLYTQLLQDEMENNKPYLLQDCKLETIAARINITTHLLSHLLNVHMKINFTDFVNEYRCRHACTLLADIATRNLTMEAIGQQCGFSSRTNFHSAFRKVHGTTPTRLKTH